MTKEEVLKKKIGFISLGCDKNRVDLENMIANIVQAGFEITNNEEEANIIIVNTCAFLEASRFESMAELAGIQELRQVNLEKVIVTGCLSRYKNMYKEELNGVVDDIIQIKENNLIVSKIFSLYGIETNCQFDETLRVLTTPNHIAYLKISEGCNNKCAYCAIPNIRGKYVSRTIESLVNEAKSLASKGVKELIIVAQDVTNYGQDIYKKRSLIELLKELEKIEGISWIRLHYCYPEYITDDLIEFIKNSKKIVNYIDVPFQHVVEDVLIMMNRKNTEEMTYELTNKLKNENFSIRSTFMVGFPGETKQDFKQLIKFLKTYKLENVGFFAYSNEVGTKAFEMTNQIPEKEKLKRLNKIEKVQTKIYEAIQKKKVGSLVDVMIDEVIDDEIYVGRTPGNSFGVDSIVSIVAENKHNLGDIIKVRIIKTDGIDLIGVEE